MLPPRKLVSFLRWFCREDCLEEIEGDLTELFVKDCANGATRARWLFAWRLLKYLRPEFTRALPRYRPLNTLHMIRTYLKIALRNLARNRSYSFINIGGLALGMTITILIGLWIHDELSFNTYHQSYNTIAQIWAGETDSESGTIDGSYALQLPLAVTLRENYNHYFRHILLAWWIGDYTLSANELRVSKRGIFIEPGGPEMLSLKILKGRADGLSDPHSILLSESTAKAVFGDADPINKRLQINNRMEVLVTGVYEDIPANNRFAEVQFFAPWQLWHDSNRWISANATNWENRAFNIYVELQPGISVEEANAAIHDVYLKTLPKDLLKQVEGFSPYVQAIPMSTWHLYSEFENGKPATGRITFVWLFGITGAFVLLLACINFINLNTARSEKRAREVGVRKSVGSDKWQLVLQFLSESVAVVVVAFLLSAALVVLSLDFFNELASKDIALPFRKPAFWLIIVVFIGFTALLAGVYPAFYLSSFQPAKVIKGTLATGRSGSLPRKILVVLQFTVSVVLIVGTLVVHQQIEYARNRPVGYDRNALLTGPLDDPGFSGKLDVLRNELTNTGAVTHVAYSSYPITSVRNTSGGFQWTGRDPYRDIDFAMMNVSHDFGKTVGWEFVAGRDFSRAHSSDSAAIIINETAAKMMGLKEPVDELVTHEQLTDTWTIVGVIKDMVMGSPYEPVQPTIFFFDVDNEAAAQIQLRLKNTANAGQALASIAAVVKEIVPSAMFDVTFVDQEYATKFSQEKRIGTLAGLFAGFAIFISCMGLYGLASYVAEQRTKEIGIRKVLGATVPNLLRLLSKEFVILVVFSCVIAVPLSVYLMNTWLQKYSYRTEISPWLLLGTIAAAVVITIFTVSWQALKAALMNPVCSLRSE